jgi:CO/xanthine dehydrogenase Mo-binding subunit
LRLEAGVVRDETGSALISIRDLLGRYAGEGYSISAAARFSTAESPLLKADPGEEWISSIFWMLCSQAAEIEVDIETGVIRVVRVAAAADVGKAINPLTCEQQIEGGVIMGVSNGILEGFSVVDGKIRNGSFADYKIATIADTPEIIPSLIESVHGEAPFGAKGIGEPAAAATPPAIANALYDAIGVRIRDLPLTPEKVIRALEEQERTERGK